MANTDRWKTREKEISLTLEKKIFQTLSVEIRGAGSNGLLISTNSRSRTFRKKLSLFKAIIELAIHRLDGISRSCRISITWKTVTAPAAFEATSGEKKRAESREETRGKNWGWGRGAGSGTNRIGQIWRIHQRRRKQRKWSRG